MRFILRKAHKKVHQEFREKHRCIELSYWLDKEYPDLFLKMTNEERFEWTKQAIAKADEYEFNSELEHRQEFCRILARVGLEFDSDPRCDSLKGVFTDPEKYTGYALNNAEQLNLINSVLDSNSATAIGTRKGAGCNCIVPD